MSELPASILLVKHGKSNRLLPLEYVLLISPERALKFYRDVLRNDTTHRCFSALIQRPLPIETIKCQVCPEPARHFWMGTRKKDSVKSYTTIPFLAGLSCDNPNHLDEVGKQAWIKHCPISKPLTMTFISSLECGKLAENSEVTSANECINLLLKWSGYGQYFTPQEAVDLFSGIPGQFSLDLYETNALSPPEEPAIALSATPP